MRLAAIAFALGGCFLSSGDDAAGICGDGTVDPGEECDDGNSITADSCFGCKMDIVQRNLRIGWSLRNVASSQPTGCPSGYDTAEVVTQEVTSDGMPIGSPRVDVFDCSRNEGSVAFDSSSVAVVRATVRITTGTGGTVYAESVPVTVDLSVGDGDVSVAILNDGGYFRLAWTLRGQTSGNELTCSTVEPDDIKLVSSLASPSTMYTDRFTCADGEGLTGALPAGSYTATVEAEANDSPLGPAATVTNKVILDKNRVTDLGVVEIPIAGL